MDIRLPPTHTDEGMRAAIEIRAEHPDVGVLVLSQYVELGLALKLLADSAEGVGYLLKDRVSNVDEFTDAVRRVGAGGSALDPIIVSTLLAKQRSDGPLGALTPREREVLELMAEGLSNQGIADRLVLSLRAVEKYVSTIFTKLGLPPPAATRAACWRCCSTSAPSATSPPPIRTPETRPPNPGARLTTPGGAGRWDAGSYPNARGEAMKTRVMQNEPGEPQKAADPAPSQPTPPTNIAGRMGRWSAGHWKTAVFGWLAFVVARGHARHGRRHEGGRRQRRRRGRVQARRSDPRRRLQAARRRDRSHPERDAHRERPRVRGRNRRHGGPARRARRR